MTIKIENQTQVLQWLREDDPEKLDELFSLADQVRRENTGDGIHLRGLIEVSNQCSRDCAYCGLNVSNKKINRYSLTDEEIFACVDKALELGYGTAVLQAGEDKTIDPERIVRIIKQIKKTTGLAITLSLGEWPDDIYQLWKQAGADRYLLKFETSDRNLFERIHPGSDQYRTEMIPRIQQLGFEMGSGVMVGLPGQSYQSLAGDIMLFSKLNLDMIGVGPFIPDPDTIMGKQPELFNLDVENQVPNSEIMAIKAIALTRLKCPTTNMPVTTSLATLNSDNGLEKALCCGGNVIMPNLTPMRYRTDYQIYPGKASLVEPEMFLAKLKHRFEAIGRHISKGRGDSAKFLYRTERQVPHEHKK